MEKTGHIEIKVKGQKGNLDLNPESGEIDKSALKLVAIIDYNPSFKEDYINSLIKKAKKSWGDVPDADEWLQNVRGYGA